MARFIDVHDDFAGATPQEMEEAHARDLEYQDAEGMTFERLWLDPECGKAFCLSRGPSKEALMRVHERAGHPTSEIYLVAVEVD